MLAIGLCQILGPDVGLLAIILYPVIFPVDEIHTSDNLLAFGYSLCTLGDLWELLMRVRFYFGRN